MLKKVPVRRPVFQRNGPEWPFMLMQIDRPVFCNQEKGLTPSLSPSLLSSYTRTHFLSLYLSQTFAASLFHTYALYHY